MTIGDSPKDERQEVRTSPSRRMHARVIGRSFGHSVIRSFSHSVIRSFGHSISRSFGHSVIRSFGHSVIRSFGHSVRPARRRHRIACDAMASVRRRRANDGENEEETRNERASATPRASGSARGNALKASIVALAAHALARTKPTTESFYAHCVEHEDVLTRTTFEVAFRSSPRWVCSSSHAFAFAREAPYACRDALVATACRTRDGAAYVGALGRWVRAPRALAPVVITLVNVIMVHKAACGAVVAVIAGLAALKTLKLLKTLVLGVFAAAAAYVALPRYLGVPRSSIAITAGMYFVAYRRGVFDGALRLAKRLQPARKKKR